MRTIVDRGVIEYASAKTDADQARGARLIQTAGLMGYPPACDLLARNYSQSEAVHALGPLNDVAATTEDAKQIFLALGQDLQDQGIYSPPTSWIHCEATRVRISVFGSPARGGRASHRLLSRYLLMQIAASAAFARACRHSASVSYEVPWPPCDVSR
jgi:hypothetical protein